MKNINKYSKTCLISAMVVLISFINIVVACGRPMGMLPGTIAGETREIEAEVDIEARQEIINYLNSVKPILKAHADLYEEVDNLALNGSISERQALEEWKNLLNRMQIIYKDVKGSLPPSPLYEFKRIWELECEILIKSLNAAMQAIEKKDKNLVREYMDYRAEASKLRDESQEELLDVLLKYYKQF